MLTTELRDKVTNNDLILLNIICKVIEDLKVLEFITLMISLCISLMGNLG